MYQRQIPAINASLAKTRKAIISLGCSFVQGQGAVNDEMYIDYKWDFIELGTPLQLNVSAEEKIKIRKRYGDLITTQMDGKLDFTFMEYENAFVNVLCKKYFEESYTAINLGIRGCGNRATIKDLYFYPEIDWHLADEIIVVYSPSGMERFDFINDSFDDHHHWKCMWPHPKGMDKSARKSLWEGYAGSLYSEKFEVLENIAHVQELINWCKVRDAKLIITPAFDKRFNRKHMEAVLMQTIDRKMSGDMLAPPYQKHSRPENLDRLLGMWPWELMYKPGGYETFVELVVGAENLGPGKDHHFFQFLGKGSPNGWITSCAHPSARGHDLFAKYLHHYITTGDAEWKE
jgi:hypothetical protein